jgi:hypothetical protein
VETFTVSLSNVSANAQPGDLQATGTIVDNEQVECGYSWGDPHYVTADGLIYDMQACGEFVLVETRNVSDPSPLTVQTRTAMYGPNVSVNTAVATLVDGHRVTIDTLETEPLRIDGQVMTIASGDSVALGGGQIHYDAGVYSIVFPTQERLIVTDRGSYVDVRLCASADRPDGSLHGLLGNFDGNVANDLATRDGTVLPTQPTFAQLYDTFANSWRITQAESLFDYRAGESTASFSDENCPIQKTTRASLPADKVAEAIALLDAAGITDPALREAAILDYALTGDPSFITSAGEAGAPSESVNVIDPTIIWTNGGQVIIGSSDSPSQFDIGTRASTPAGVNWTGAAASDNWSESGNWSPDAPASTDAVVFDAIDADGTSIVDQDFAIAALLYTGEVASGTGAADHVTDFDEGSTLAVSGSATIGANNSQSRVNLTIANGTAVVAHVTELNVGYNATGSGGITGNLTVTSGASLDAADVASLSIGRETGAANVSTPAANGSLILGNQSTITLGTANALATLNIGWSQNTNSYYATGSASGLLDATEGSFTAMLDTLRIGQTANVGSASGQFIMGAGSSVTTRSADIGMGSGGNGTLTVLGDALTFTGADSALNFGTGTLEVPGTTFTVGSAAEALSALRIGYINSGTGPATTAIDLSASNPTFTAVVSEDLSIGRETGSNHYTTTAADGTLTLGSNSTITLGTATDLATLSIGWSQNTNGYSYGASATGRLDTTEGGFIAHLDTLRIGQTANVGSASGQFIMGAGSSVTTRSADIGMGSGGNGTLTVLGDALTFTGADSALNFGTGTLEVPGTTFTVGSAAEALSALRIGYINSGTGPATTAIDLSASNPTFTAVVSEDLSIGRETGSNHYTTTAADGTLTLGSNSTITLGTATDLATLSIGWSQNTNGYSYGASATGRLDTTEGGFIAHLDTLRIGQTANVGSASGQFIMGAGSSVTTRSADIGMGSGGNGTLTVLGDALTFTGADSALNFGTGTLEVPGTTFTVGSAAEALSALRIGYINSGTGPATTAIDLSASNPTFTAVVSEDLSIGRETGSNHYTTTAADGTLTLGSNSTITLGTATNLATLSIGWSQNTNGYSYGASATGRLDTTEGGFIAHLDTLRIGQTANVGSASGQFIMGAGSSVTTRSADIGMGSGGNGTLTVLGDALTFTGADSALNFGTGTLEVPGTTFTVGSAAEALSALRIGYINSGTGPATTAIDLSASNPTFTAVVSEDLSIGRETGSNHYTTTAADGTLTLGSNSTITLGTATDLATLSIGWSQNTNGYSYGASATGRLDTTEGGFIAHLDTLRIGQTANVGSASGQFIMGAGSSVTTRSADIGMGSGGNGTLTVLGDALTFTGADSALNFGTGTLEVPGTTFTVGSAAEALSALRIGYINSGTGPATTAIDLSASNPTFTAVVSEDLSIGRETGSNHYTTTAADGTLTLGSNSTITLGTATNLATLSIGWSQNTNGYSYGASATGRLDTTEGGFIAHLDTLRIGQTANVGSASGQFIMGAGSSVTTRSADIGMGSGGNGTLTVLGDALTFTGADSALNFGTGTLEVPGTTFTVGSAAEALSALRIGYINSGTGPATTAIDLSASNPTFTAVVSEDLSIGRETGSNHYTTTAADGTLTLGSNSTITLGTATDLATLSIGWSQNTNGYSYGASATGRLDTTEGGFIAHLDTLRIGQTANVGSASGQFIMGAGSSVTTRSADIGMGSGGNGTLTVLGDALTFTGADSALNFGTGTLEVPGTTFTVGSAAEALSALRIGYINSGTGPATTAIDLSASNPTFTAVVSEDLSIGRETGSNHYTTTAADGTLTLGSNSTITLGTATDLATLSIGWSQNTNGYSYGASATGRLDTTEGGFIAHLDTLRIGQTSASAPAPPER